jgi:phospholipid N-methyltransferase
MWADHALFLQQFFRRFRTTGAILPSGRRLAAALSRYVTEGNGAARRILEVGPGTGAVTHFIVRSLGPADRLDLVELNAQFVQRLRQRFETEPALAAASRQTRILHQPVEELSDSRCYDVIVSGLPLNNFAVADVERLLATLARLLAPGGTLSFFQYVGVRRAKALVCGAEQRRRLQGIERALQELLAGREIRRECIWLNLPPAWVHHVRVQSRESRVQSPESRVESPESRV